MHTQRSSLLTALILLFFSATFTGCLKDECSNTYTIYRPIYKNLAEVRSAMKWEGSRNIENPGKIYLYGKYLLLNDVGQGIHVFDNSVPASPKNLGFLRIGGNVDMAIRNNILYADSYADMAVIPVNDWANAKPVAFRDKVFADRNNYWQNATNPNDVQVIVGYERKDTIVDCETVSMWNSCPNCAFADASGRPVFSSSNAGGQATNGTGGSMARFTLVDNYLYTVTRSSLQTFDVTNVMNPQKVAENPLGWNIETIYPFGGKLFIGSMTGMFVFDLANPAAPVQQGIFSHARVCDPVVADGRYAFVTLRSGQTCGGTLNQLDVVDVANVHAPALAKTYPLANPHGLSKDGNLLFVCDGSAGLKIFDASNPLNLKLLQTVGGLGATYDVIAQNGIAMVVTKEGLFQFDYANFTEVKQLSKIPLAN
jgi:hypothetical protein